MTTPTELVAQLADPATTDAAVDALVAAGDTVVDELAAAMLDPRRGLRVRELCAQILGSIAPRGVARLLQTLAAVEGLEADLAAWGLRWNLDRPATETALFERLTDASPRVRSNAARALRYIHVDLGSCDARLLAALRDPVAPVRRDALLTVAQLAQVGLDQYGLRDIGPVRAAALGSLADADAEVREAAARLLAALASQAGDAAPDS